MIALLSLIYGSFYFLFFTLSANSWSFLKNRK